MTCSAAPVFWPQSWSTACSTAAFWIEPVLNLMNVTLRAEGSFALFLANRLGLVPKLVLAFVPALTMASSVAPSERT